MATKNQTVIAVIIMLILTAGFVYVGITKSIVTYGMSLSGAVVIFVVPIMSFMSIVVYLGYRAGGKPEVSRHSD